jgi:hypothetical protein
MLIPFFKGKELDTMVNDFIVQLRNVAKWFGALTQTTAFASHTKNSGVVAFWKLYFEQMSAQVTELRAQEGVLVSRLLTSLSNKATSSPSSRSSQTRSSTSRR